jgi:NAD(P)-dependent dehydrogenase (short-subunit alcohol dehydrogenase family)
MSTSTPVLFILGAGPKIGKAVADAFAAKGYKVALAARSLQEGVGDNGYLHLKLDLTNTKDIEEAFAKVTKKLGIPTVVVYNGACCSLEIAPSFRSRLLIPI